ncbi:MAG: biopolymer transporter ExbD [Cyanobacteria bacterium P01_F01_bin.42]
MKTFVDQEPSEVRVEIIPLVDVVFCVLTFFILAAVGLTRVKGIGIDLPQSNTATAKFGNKLALQVNPVGEIFLKNQPVTEDQLVQQLTDFRRVNPAGLIVIDADRQASYEKIIQILDLLQALNIDRVALGSIEQTSPNNSPFNLQPPPPSLPLPPSPPTAPTPEGGIGVPPPGQPPLTPINPGTSNGTAGR